MIHINELFAVQVPLIPNPHSDFRFALQHLVTGKSNNSKRFTFIHRYWVRDIYNDEGLG